MEASPIRQIATCPDLRHLVRFAELPPESDFLDVDGIPVARLPDGSCIAFEKRGSEESRPFVDGSKAGHDGDALTREEFASWLKTGFNRFDVRAENDDPPPRDVPGPVATPSTRTRMHRPEVQARIDAILDRFGPAVVDALRKVTTEPPAS
jgi:hypothetical protein